MSKQSNFNREKGAQPELTITQGWQQNENT